jgi:hypothetical protein
MMVSEVSSTGTVVQAWTYYQYCQRSSKGKMVLLVLLPSANVCYRLTVYTVQYIVQYY